MKKPVSAALALVAMLAGLLGVCSATSAPAGATTTPLPHTTVTVRVTGCNGCRVVASSWVHLRSSSWHSAPRVVRHGKVTFHPPTRRTTGLALTVLDMHAVNDGAVPIAVMRYASARAGHGVTARQAKRGTHGFVCWAGTSARRASFHLTVDRFPAVGLGGDHGYGIRVYADPAVRTLGDRRTFHKGIYETQDQPLCFG